MSAPGKPIPKTQAMRVLEAHGVPYQPLAYEAPEHLSAAEVAAAVGLPPEQTFKTLVVLPERPGARPILALLPATTELDPKKLAAAAGEKRVALAPLKDAERLSGMKRGGISPLALLDRGWPVFIDETALLFDKIEVSAGRVGVGVLVPVAPLIQLTGATPAPLG